MSSKQKSILLIVTLVVVGVVAWTVFGIWQSSKNDPKLRSTSESNFVLNGIDYNCSYKIDGEWVEGGFKPSNQEDFEKFCREGIDFVIEYRAVIDILRRDDINQLITKYNTTEAWVRALGHRYINDKNYISRILPTYTDVQIDCIIVVHSPEGTRFFIENGERHESHDDHQYIEVPAAEFLASLNQASDEDVTNFWLGLR